MKIIYCAWERFGGGNFWQTIQVKATYWRGKFWLMNKSVRMPNKLFFSISVNIDEVNFSKKLTI